MRLKQIAALVLITYAAISMAVAFHNHFGEQPGNHCNVCQILHAPGQAQTVTTAVPFFNVQGICLPFIEADSRTLLISYASERSPPIA